MDSLTASHLARELDARWRGRRVESCVFDREARAVTMGVEGLPVRFELDHPDVRVRETEPPLPDAAFRGWTVRAVRAPVDDRRLVIELGRPGRFKGSAERLATLEVSALPTSRGAVLRDAGGARMGGGSVGSRLPPVVAPRPVLGDQEILSASRACDLDRLLTGRWMSPLVARWLCDEPERAVERYHLICSDRPARPSRCGDRVVPFPVCADAVPVASLVEPIAHPVEAVSIGEDGRRVRARARMHAELERARDAPMVRAVADALVALGDAAPPQTVTLADGTLVPVPTRPGETSADVAARLYADAKSKDRALASLPARLAHAAPAPRPLGERPARPASARTPAPRLPYRTYRSSGGLDIWVGRGASSNDDLTFHAAAPDDVWLHARDAAGAHVVLRWSKPDAPPARDLNEAALLAAWHSRSRGSAVVPVDWTRRKHVRKPRGAKPGTVVLQQSRTVMVRPDGEVERRLRTEVR